MAEQTDIPSTDQNLKEAQAHEKQTPAEQAVVKQEDDLKTGAENPT